MAAIHYLTEYDRVKAFDTYKPIILDMDEVSLRVLILILINGADLDYAIDIAMSGKK